MTAVLSARAYLRGATTQQHARLDAAASAMHLETASGYAQFLQAQASVLIPLEQSLCRNGISDVLPDWAERRRTEALKADLADLHISFAARTVPDFSGTASLLGAAYVLEGSRLGASFILKNLTRRTATRFLRHGEGSRLWQGFLDVLESNSDVRENPERAAESARRVFSLFIDAMAPNEMVAA